MRFDGKFAVITGANRGIGRAIAETLAAGGAQVALAARDLNLSAQVAEKITAASGQRVIPVQVDVADSNSVKAMVEQVLADFGRIDILVNNAGITRDNLIVRISEADWDDVIDINLKGTFNCSKAVIRPMMKQRYGRIINISSVSGLAGQAGQTNYSSSKAGIIGFTKALAREVASRQITVNAVAPGYIPTDLTNDLPQELIESFMKSTPIGRMGTPEEVAFAVAFLASDKASYITGQVISVDGGMAMM